MSSSSPPVTYYLSAPNTPPHHPMLENPPPKIHPQYDRPSSTPTLNSRQTAKLQTRSLHTPALDTRTTDSCAPRPLCHWGTSQIQFWMTRHNYGYIEGKEICSSTDNWTQNPLWSIRQSSQHNDRKTWLRLLVHVACCMKCLWYTRVVTYKPVYVLYLG